MEVVVVVVEVFVLVLVIVDVPVVVPIVVLIELMVAFLVIVVVIGNDEVKVADGNMNESSLFSVVVEIDGVDVISSLKVKL